MVDLSFVYSEGPSRISKISGWGEERKKGGSYAPKELTFPKKVKGKQEQNISKF